MSSARSIALRAVTLLLEEIEGHWSVPGVNHWLAWCYEAQAPEPERDPFGNLLADTHWRPS